MEGKMYKKANSPPPYWQSILTKVKNLGLRPEIMAMLNNFNQIVWDAAPPADNPNAIAYVSSEDKNNDGKIDKIHFVLNKFPANANEEQMDGIVEMVAKTLVHEYGHIEDFNPETNEFPGGEGAAEQAERAFEPLLNQKLNLTTNSSYNLYNKYKISGEIKLLKELVKLANHLDAIGHGEISNDLDSVIKKLAEFPEEEGRERYLEQSRTLEERDYMIERKEQSVVSQAKDMIEKITEGYYGSAVENYAMTPSIGKQTLLNKWLSSPVETINQAKAFLRDFRASMDLLRRVESAGQLRMFDSFYDDRMESAADSLSSRLEEYATLVRSPANMPAEISSPALKEKKRGPANLTMQDTDSEEELLVKSPTVSKIQGIVGAEQTGVWADLIGSGSLKAFLEENAENISSGPGEYLEDSEKASKILAYGVKGFRPRGGTEALDNSYKSWLKFIEELASIETKLEESIAPAENEAHDEDYMSKHHAESIADNAEEISEDLEKGLKLDPWQKTYLAQADLMTDNVEERLDAMAKQLDKLFKY